MLLNNTKNTRKFSEIDERLTDLIIRSDRVDNLDQNDIKRLLDENINIIIDLRKDKERTSSVRSNVNFDYNVISFNIIEWSKLKEELGNNILNIIYDILPEQYLNYTEQKDVIYRIFNKIIQANNGVLIMCHHGKDRTGVVVALLLLIAGIDKEIIIQDYSLSTHFLEMNSFPGEIVSFESKPIIMEKFLEIFFKKFNDIDSYLTYIGINETDRHVLRQKLFR